jgi:hypothetical protein
MFSRWKSGVRATSMVWVCALSAACGPEDVVSAVQKDCVDSLCSDLNDCDGDDPEAFCDDCNPCTTDVNCTPCSALAPADRNIHSCTEDAELDAICAGELGCVHASLTTPVAQINACFPVAGALELHSGACLEGVCVENVR